MKQRRIAAAAFLVRATVRMGLLVRWSCRVRTGVAEGLTLAEFNVGSYKTSDLPRHASLDDRRSGIPTARR